MDAVRAMEAGAGEPLRELRADGGATANRWLMHVRELQRRGGSVPAGHALLERVVRSLGSKVS